jgi:hypothetical protein
MPQVLTAEERARLREHLLRTLVAGPTRTPRSVVVRNAELLAAGDPDKSLGLEFPGLSVEEAMEAVAALCGCSADPRDREGPGVIDPDRTIAETEAMAVRLAQAADRGERVLVCTGHPTGLLPLYMAVVRALARSGAKILMPRQEERIRGVLRGRRLLVRYFDGVGVLTDGVNLLHTHDARPMEALLEGATPDLVLADHGFAGAAVARGIETLAFNDVNDPALAAAKARRSIDVVVPLDDNLPPDHYDPLVRVLVRAIRG